MSVRSGKSQGIIDTFVARLTSGEAIQVWGRGDVVRDYVHIDDVVSAFALVLERQTESQVFNIGTGVGTSIHQILGELSIYFNLKDRVVWLPGRDFDLTRNVLNISRAQTELGWQPRIALRDGIKRIVENYEV